VKFEDIPNRTMHVEERKNPNRTRKREKCRDSQEEEEGENENWSRGVAEL